MKLTVKKHLISRAMSTNYADAQPIYDTLPGWEENIEGVRNLEDLPQAAREYLDFISQYVKRPITFVSVGPERKQTILCGAEMERSGSA